MAARVSVYAILRSLRLSYFYIKVYTPVPSVIETATKNRTV